MARLPLICSGLVARASLGDAVPVAVAAAACRVVRCRGSTLLLLGSVRTNWNLGV